MPLTLSTALPTALSSSSIARGLDGSRRSRPTFSRLARWACTVDEDASPTALPMSRTVGGYPYLAEYRLMKSKISCWRFVRSIDDAPRAGDEVRKRTLVRTLAGAPDGLKGGGRRSRQAGVQRGLARAASTAACGAMLALP